MPSWPVHITLATRLNKNLNLSDDFIIGNVLPDSMSGFIVKGVSKVIAHPTTHYNSNKSGKPKIEIDNFVKDYHHKFDNPIILGYLVHLLTDSYFNAYTHAKHIINKDGKNYAILNDDSIETNVTPWKIKQDDFHKFGNKLIYDKCLGNTIKLSDNTLKYLKDLNFNITDDDIKKTIDKANSIITKKVSGKEKYKMFTEQELTNVLNECEKYINDYIKKIKKTA